MMSEEPTPLVFDGNSGGQAPEGGEAIDAGKGRIFPCEQCGADLIFSIGQQSLTCSHCGDVKQIEIPPDEEIVEQDLEAMLRHLAEQREKGELDQSATGEHAVWLLAYRYHDQPYRVAINAATGEVQGQRPYSWVKITCAVASVVAVILAIFALTQS